MLLLALVCSCASPNSDEGGVDASSSSTTDDPSTESGTAETETETGGEPDQPVWLATWSASPQDANPIAAPAFDIEDQSLRQIAHVSLGGAEVRVRLANTFGEADLPVAAARLALSAGGAAIEPGSDRPLSVDGSTVFVIPAGSIVVSDPVTLDVPALADLSLSLYFDASVSTTTVHAEAQQTTWLVDGDLSAEPSWPTMASTSTSSYWFNAIEILAPPGAATIVALGDSITDGSGSTLGANHRWPDLLAQRLQANAATADVAVVNAGIGGNCVLRDFIGPRALDRFERDVLDQPGVAWVVITEGINDIGVGSILGQPVTAEQLIDGYLELIEEAHARGLLVYGGTLLPYAGADYFTEEGELVRQAVNAWIRDGGAYDAVVDFDAATRDPEAQDRLLAAYDSGDHLHPSDAVYAAMA